MKSSDAGIFLHYTYMTMKQMGIDVDKILAEVGLPAQIPDKSIRRDNACQRRFWKAAENITNDQNIGLHVGENFPVIRGLIFEHIFLSSSGFRVGLESVLSYQKLLSSAFTLRLIEQNHLAVLHGFNHPVRHYMDITICIALIFFKLITNNKFFAKKICLPYEKGAVSEEYQRVWNCEMEFGRKIGKIIFDVELLNLRFDSYEPELFMIHENYAKRLVKQVEKYELIYEIEKILANGLLEQGDVNLTRVATQLNVNANTLRANLADIDSSFEKILTKYRIKTAKKLLKCNEISIGHIVNVLGFSESSVFSRAFKRWTGESPLRYRKRKTTKNDFIDT